MLGQEQAMSTRATASGPAAVTIRPEGNAVALDEVEARPGWAAR